MSCRKPLCRDNPNSPNYVSAEPISQRSKNVPYNPTNHLISEWKYVPNKPAVVTSTHVNFWVTPVFTDIFYTSCGPDDNECENCSRGTTFYTGVKGKYSAGNLGFKCYGEDCNVGRSRLLCGSIAPPWLGPGLIVYPKIVAIEYSYDENKKIPKYIQVEYELRQINDSTWNENWVRYVVNNTYDGQNQSKFIPKEVSVALLKHYCKSDPTKNGCYLLRLLNKDEYNEVLKNFCKDKNLETDTCFTYCQDKDVNCNQPIVNYCQGLGPDKALGKNASSKTKELCGCFMGNEFYKGYFDELKKKFQWPAGAPPSHVCYFDYCSSSNMKPYNERQNPTKCPDVLSCFQMVNIDFNSRGNIVTGDIIIKQDAKCTQIKKKCNVQSDCNSVPGSTCTNNLCLKPGESPNPPGPPGPPGKQCITSKDCLHNQTCIEGNCKVYDGCLNNAQCPTNSVCSNKICKADKTNLSLTSWIIIVVIAILTLVVIF